MYGKVNIGVILQSKKGRRERKHKIWRTAARRLNFYREETGKEQWDKDIVKGW
jgi:hypothetical protein